MLVWLRYTLHLRFVPVLKFCENTKCIWLNFKKQIEHWQYVSFLLLHGFTVLIFMDGKAPEHSRFRCSNFNQTVDRDQLIGRNVDRTGSLWRKYSCRRTALCKKHGKTTFGKYRCFDQAVS